MEPSLIGWEWLSASASSQASQPPQWSPALSAGNGSRGEERYSAMSAAAMEPSLIGWEWLDYVVHLVRGFATPQWSPALSAGNGSRAHVHT